MVKKEPIQIIWLKKDLRTTDHDAFYYASTSDLKTIVLYLFEPSVMQQPDYDIRHHQFIIESLSDVQKTLDKFRIKVHIYRMEALKAFDFLLGKFDIKLLISHQETGNLITFKRDLQVKEWCNANSVTWKEFKQMPVFRGLKSRENWTAMKQQFYNSPIQTIDYSKINPLSLETGDIEHTLGRNDFANSLRQKGGEKMAQKTLDDFMQRRHFGYLGNISKPQPSQFSCSRLSPYLTFGCISERYVFHICHQYQASRSVNRRDFDAFLTRLSWRSHFIQKLESAYTYETQNINPAFDQLDRKLNLEYLEAWKTGNTGYPMVDACMRSLIATGWINFRMRAMLVSFLTHTLWQPWQLGASHLAKLFLDYEPGIHYPQIQMQASTTGVHTLRIYNPVKQSYDQDADLEFIKRWVPELDVLPKFLRHEPWKLNPLEAALYNWTGSSYPKPIIDHEIAARNAKKKISEVLKSDICKERGKEILRKLSNPNSITEDDEESQGKQKLSS